VDVREAHFALVYCKLLCARDDGLLLLRRVARAALLHAAGVHLHGFVAAAAIAVVGLATVAAAAAAATAATATAATTATAAAAAAAFVLALGRG